MKSFDNERYRRKAAERLKCCWGECVGEVFVVTAILTIAAILFLLAVECLFRAGVISFGISDLGSGGSKLVAAALIYLVLLYIMLIPLKYGAAWFYFQEACSTTVPGSGFFSCYMHGKHIKDTLGLELMVIARRVGVAAFPIAFIVFMVLHFRWLVEVDPSMAAASLAVLTIVGALLVFMYIIYHLRYIFVPYLYASDPEKTPKEIIAESVRVAKGSRFGIIKLVFSLAPLWISCVLVFPLIFVIPYTKMTFASAAAEIFYSYRSDEQHIEKAESSKEEALV
ncbi:MAG: hypothetical protein ACI4YB_06055 [Oscillospiraceae bacterium]